MSSRNICIRAGHHCAQPLHEYLGIINTFVETYGFEGKTVIFFATSGGSDVTGADRQFQAQYPDINWKPGKLLNRPSKKVLEDWVEANNARKE